MKKKLLPNLLIVFFILTFRFSDAQPIINSGFESWSNNSLSRLDVDGWLTSNTQYSAVTLVQDVPYAGSHSAKMVSIYDAGAGSYVGGDMGTTETYSSAYARPGSLKGYFKQNVQSVFDHVYVTVDIYDSLSNVIGTGTFNPPPLTNYSTFTLFNAPISYTGNGNMWGYLIFISFFAGTQSNAIWGAVDNIYFDVASGIDEANGLEKLISIYPNPGSNQITVEATDKKIQDIKIYNVIGEKIISLSPEQFSVTGKESASINVAALPEGIYIVETIVEGGSIRKKFVKNNK